MGPGRCPEPQLLWVLPNCTDLLGWEQTLGSCSPHGGSAMFSLKRHLGGKNNNNNKK